MIEPGTLTAVLLCAGLSQRYGPGDKLLAPLAGTPLLLHAATMVAALPVERRIAVVPPGPRDSGVPGLLGPLDFELVENPHPANGKDSSLRLGLASALAGACSGVLLCLGDMPSITEMHIAALCEAADARQAAVSSCDDWWSPPLVLPRALARQAVLEAHLAVRAVVERSPFQKVPTTREALADLDRPRDFQRLEAQFADGKR